MEKTIKMPEPTQDQVAYLAGICSAGSYDPNTVIGGPQVESLLHRIMFAQAASCNCDTKTHELKFHNPKCRYRVLGECAAMIAGQAKR